MVLRGVGGEYLTHVGEVGLVGTGKMVPVRRGLVQEDLLYGKDAAETELVGRRCD